MNEQGSGFPVNWKSFLKKEKKTGLSIRQKGKQDEDFSIIPSEKQVMALWSHGINLYCKVWQRVDTNPLTEKVVVKF